MAFEVAQQLVAEGQAVPVLALIDATPGPTRTESLDQALANYEVDNAQVMVFALGHELGVSLDELRQLEPDDQIRFFLERAKAAQLIFQDFEVDQAKHMLEVYKANFRAYYNYEPRPYFGPVILFRAADAGGDERSPYSYSALREFALGGLEIYDSPGEHHTIALEPHIEAVAERLKAYIESATATARNPDGRSV